MRRWTARLRCLVVLALALTSIAAGGSERPLVDAAKHADWTVVRALLEQGEDVTTAQADGATALHWASYWDDGEGAALLIRAGANVNAANNLGATPLWLACENGSAAMVRKLLQAGADPNAALLSGETPLMTAARTGNADVVKQVLAKGADVNAKERTYGQQTALMWAVAQKHSGVVEVLLAHGADVHARSNVWAQTVKTSTPARNHPDYIIDVQQGGNTPLLFAAQVGDVASAKLLVAAGADVNDAAASGTSATVVAAHSGHGELAAFLLEQGADPNAAEAGYTALHAAILREDEKLVGALLVHGADPNTPLLKATPVRRQSSDFFLAPAFVGATPFWLAARYGAPKSMRRLAEHGADPLFVHNVAFWDQMRGYAIGRVTEGDTTALMAATGMGHGICACPARRVAAAKPGRGESEARRLEAVKVAAELGVDVNAANADGDTALHAVAVQGYDTVVKFLVEKGARLDVRNAEGQTPLGAAMASRRRPKSTIELLRAFGAKE